MYVRMYIHAVIYCHPGACRDVALQLCDVHSYK